MTETTTPPPETPRRRRRQWWRTVLYAVVLLGLLTVGLALAAFYLTGRPVAAPQWLQERIEARIAQEVPQARITFDEMVFLAEDGLAPRVRLRGVQVRTPSGEEIISFNEFKAAFSLGALSEGVVQPRDISLSGVVATLRRSPSGRVSLRTGGTSSLASREAATLAQLIGELDGLLETPALNGLRTVDLRAVTLNFIDQRADRSWTVDGGRLRLDRNGDDLTLSADLAVLSGGTGVATLAANYTSKIGETAAEFGVSFDGVPAQDIAAQGAAFAWLEALRTQVSGSVRSGLTQEGLFAPLNATLQAASGVVQPTDGAKPIPFEGARSYFSYDPARKLLRFDEVSVDSKWVSGQADGTAVLGGTGEGAAFSDLVGQFSLSNLRANPDGLYPQPVAISQADVDFQLKLDPFRIKIGRLQIKDDGNTVLVDGNVAADDDGWRVALDAQMDALRPARLMELWPEGLKTRTRGWLDRNLLEADVFNIDAALRLAPQTPPLTYVAFDYDKAKVRFLRSMPPITDGQGHFSMVDNRLVITLDKGGVDAPQGGRLDATGSSFILPDIMVRDGTPAVIRLAASAPATALLSLLNEPPLRVMDKARLPVTLAQGRAELSGTLALPLKRGTDLNDLAFHFDGNLLDVTSDTLVTGRRLAAERMIMVVDNKGLQISGRGTIDGVGFSGTFAQPIGAGSDKSTVRGQVTLTKKALDTFGITLPKGMISGQGPARVSLDLERGAAPRYSVFSSLQGLTLRVPQVSWVKPAGVAGKLSLAGRLGAVPTVETLEVSGAGLTATGDITLTDRLALKRLRFNRLRVGNWLDVPVDLIGQGSGKALQVVLRGGSLDMRRAQFGGSGDSGGGGGEASGPPGPPMQVNLDSLQITDTIALTGLSGQFGTAKGLDGSFVAALNGGARVEGRVLPQDGRSAVRLTSKDAGGVLRSAGLLKQVVGGNLSLTLLPVGRGGAFDGRVTANAIRVKDAPGIAGLLNAVSVVGLINELNGDGIYFDDVEGDFRLTPNRLTLTKASAVGASMGLSMDGIYGLDTGNINMRGVITPVYLLNGIGSVLTRKGEGLFGFNYSLTGPATQPAVSVNPLSGLAPGMLRDVLRKPRAALPEVDGVTDSTLPDAKPERTKPVAEQHEGR